MKKKTIEEINDERVIKKRKIENIFKNKDIDFLEKVERYLIKKDINKKEEFSKVNSDKDVRNFFGVDRLGMSKLAINFEQIENSQLYVDIVNEIFEQRKELKKLDWKGDERGSRSYIDDIIRATLKFTKQDDVKVSTGFQVEGKFHEGPLDYSIHKNGCLVVITCGKGL